ILEADTKSITGGTQHIELYMSLADQANRAVLAQDGAVRLVQQGIEEDASAIILMQKIALFTSLACFFMTLAYAYYRIALPVNSMYGELKDHRDNLEQRVTEQTADIQAARKKAEDQK